MGLVRHYVRGVKRVGRVPDRWLITEGGLASQQGIVAGGGGLMRGFVVASVAYTAGLALTWSHTRELRAKR